MTTVIEDFVAKLGWDIDNSKLIQYRRTLKSIDQGTSAFASRLTGVLKRSFFVAAGGATVLGGGIAWLGKQFSRIEDAQAAFTPLLKSEAKAIDLTRRLRETAATTPFEFENLSDVAKQLLPVMNGDLDQTIRFTRMLGDTAGGQADKMQSITRGFTKAMIKGKVDMEALNMIAEAGVPIYQELERVTGLHGEKLFKQMRRGKVTTEDLVKTFESMTGKGGIFFMGMQIASATLSGRMSTLRDNVKDLGGEIGQQLAPFLKAATEEMLKLVKRATDWVKQNKELIRSKLLEFVRKIPYYLKQIAYWAPIIAKVIGTFYAIAAAVKVSKVALDAFIVVKAIAGKVGVLGKLLKFFGTLLPLEIGKSTAAAKGLSGVLAKVGLVGGAAAAGWTIGTVIHDEIIDPIMKASYEVNRLAQQIGATLDYGPEKLPSYAIEEELKRIDKLRKMQAEDPLRQVVDFFSLTGEMERFATDIAEKRLRGALETRQGYERTRRTVNMMGPQQSGGQNIFVPNQLFTAAGGATTNMGGITINQTINAITNANPSEIANQSKRGLEKSMRQAARNAGNR